MTDNWKPTPGEYARTRDGRKAFVAGESPFPSRAFIMLCGWISGGDADFSTSATWSLGGLSMLGMESPCDLVGQWVEPLKEGTLRLEAGKYYRTAGGRKAFIVGRSPFFDDHNHWPWCGWIVGNSAPLMWSDEGVNDTDDDLLLVAEWREPVKVAGWVNVYSFGSRYSRVYETREKADLDHMNSPQRIACIYVTSKEGAEP